MPAVLLNVPNKELTEVKVTSMKHLTIDVFSNDGSTEARKLVYNGILQLKKIEKTWVEKGFGKKQKGDFR